MKDDSDAELAKFIQDIGAKFQQLSQQAKNEIHATYGTSDGIIPSKFFG